MDLVRAAWVVMGPCLALLHTARHAERRRDSGRRAGRVAEDTKEDSLAAGALEEEEGEVEAEAAGPDFEEAHPTAVASVGHRPVAAREEMRYPL